MSTPIINAQMDAINGTMATLKGDLTTLRPLIKTLKETALNAYATESLSNQAVASFTDGAKNIPVKSLSVAITPVQNLNGQANPYPAGGGKNKIGFNDVSETANGTNRKCTISNGLFTIAATGAISSAFVVIGDIFQNNGLGLTLPAGTYTYSVSDFSSSLSSIKTASIRLYLYKNGSQSRIVAPNESFTLTEAETVDHIQASSAIQWSNGTTVKFRLQIESGSTATAYAPYSNICPITGWTGANVYRAGANLYNTAFEQGNISSSGANSSTSLAKRLRSTTYDEIGTGTFKLIVQPPFQAFIRAYSTPEVAGYVSGESSTAWLSGENGFTLTDAKYVRIVIRYSDDSDITPSDFDATHFYISSAADTYPISFGQTVYGGTLNVKTGVLTVDRAMWVPDNTMQCSVSSTTDTVVVFDVRLATNSLPDAAATPNAISNQFSTSIAAGNAGRMVLSSGHLYFVIAKSQLASYDQAGARTWLTNNPTQFSYELATPTTVQLTPTEVTTLLGVNNIWADTGNILEVTIRCDTALYLQKLVG